MLKRYGTIIPTKKIFSITGTLCGAQKCTKVPFSSLFKENNFRITGHTVHILKEEIVRKGRKNRSRHIYLREESNTSDRHKSWMKHGYGTRPCEVPKLFLDVPNKATQIENCVIF